MKLTFLGAADAVTGSRHLLDTGRQRLLLDCGLFQGYKALRERNWAPLGVPANSLDAVLLSHAHLDHSGYLPALLRQGYQGQIFSTGATRDLCEVLLLDAAKLQEEDARRANRFHTSRHDKALPLYSSADARKVLTHFVGLPRDGRLRLKDCEIRFTPVGHLLGACAIRVETGAGRSLLYSGDLGRTNDLLMPPPQQAQGAEVLLIESTYGNRLHPAEDVQARLGQIIRDTLRRGGSVLLPSFAVGRAQALLLVLQRLRAAGELPHHLPILLDSPMAAQATEITRHHGRLLRIAPHELATLDEGVSIISKPAESLKAAVRAITRPSIIISASGMATGGRVLNYLKTLAPGARHHIVFPGFQVGGSRGAKMIAGDREIKLQGEYVPVNAEVSHLEGFSGHADAEGLMAWMRKLDRAPEQVFVVHGEPAASDALRSRIQDELGWRVRVPQHGETVSL
ncbi:MBL fold metallo-hydrolase [Roseateles sp. DAIF2]|uniref:MBL fold metallo-hydrolase RNA specificity domain-containing protein n=1 Tax=Roseateles sp. DAIF2 TaxID=2714952 RepID=UPI0018A29076|nr:MBL fold metallo-hydrolase [Roseateles sp. DAIF2]QPF74401.1 MBL fold metallo-hydrolase [Roseateles sp. DAIF2]